jgi:DNA-binding SARP family transcriptional activator
VLRVNLLQGFQLVSDGRELMLPMNAQRLIAFLALRERPTPRLHVAGTLWTDTLEQRSSGSLRSALWRVGLAAPGLVLASKTSLELSPDVCVDARDALKWGTRVVSGLPDAGVLGVDRRLLGGDLLPDWYDEWIVLERERLHQLRLHALERLCVCLTRTGRFAEAVQCGLEVMHAEPLRESSRRVLIQAHLAEGNRSEALREFRSYHQLLKEQLGVEPTPQLTELIQNLTF